MSRLNWIPAKNPPHEEAPYLVHCPTQDKDSPLIVIAWYSLEFGWSLLPKQWVGVISHWMPLPEPPSAIEVSPYEAIHD